MSISIITMGHTLPETNMSHLKIDGWKPSVFPFGTAYFQGQTVSFRECTSKCSMSPVTQYSIYSFAKIFALLLPHPQKLKVKKLPLPDFTITSLTHRFLSGNCGNFTLRHHGNFWKFLIWPEESWCFTTDVHQGAPIIALKHHTWCVHGSLRISRRLRSIFPTVNQVDDFPILAVGFFSKVFVKA